MKGVIAIIIACALALLGISLYNAVEETVEVMQYAPHIMDPPEKWWNYFKIKYIIINPNGLKSSMKLWEGTEWKALGSS